MLLTNEQRTLLQTLQLRGPNAAGNYSDVYALIYSWIADAPDVGNDVKLWFQGATQANADKGAFALLIREYSKVQMQLRGVPYSGSLMQQASNEVAIRAIDNILDTSRIPTIDIIAFNDATGVGDKLFGSLGADTAGGNVNAGWSGTILFSAFDSNQTGRLLTAGEVVVNPTDATQLNRLDDIKNVLFAYYAYQQAKSETLSGTWSSFSDLDIQQWKTDLGIGWDTVKSAFLAGKFSNNIAPLFFTDLASLLPPSAKQFANLIDKVGVDQAMAWIMSSYNGTPVESVKDSFVDRTQTFFSALTAQDLQTIKIKLPANPLEIGQLAKSDVNARAALAGLSPIVMDVKASVAATLTLYDPKTDTGEITDVWIEDRSKALAAYMTYWKRGETDGVLSYGLGVPFRQKDDVVISDAGIGAANELRIDGFDFGLVETRYIRFGGTSNDALIGGAGEDHLYGGKGNDTLSGKEGSDYLEGGAGKDLLYGGECSDQLYGGEDNDQLVGEEGNDLLFGGNGDDTYKFTGQFGRDMIKDSDNKGIIEFSGNTISTLQQTEKGSIVYLDDINHPTYQAIVVDEGDTKSLIITQLTNATNSVTIKNWANGNLGITLTPASEPTVPPKIITINGNDGDNALSLFNKMEDDASFTWNGSDPLSISGGKGRDLILGTYAGNDTLSGGEGDDIIMGGGEGGGEYGKDVITGDGGNDYMFSSPMNSVAHGGKGNDFIRADEAATIYVSGVKASGTNNTSYNAHPALTRDQVWLDLLSIMNYDFFFFGFKNLKDNLNEKDSVSAPGSKFLVEPLDSFKVDPGNWITGSDLIYSSRVSAFAYDYDKGLVGQHKQNWMNLNTPLSYSISGLQLYNGHTNSDTGVVNP